jgi:hypothetical protein
VGLGELDYAQGDGRREHEREGKVKRRLRSKNAKAPGLCRALRIVPPQSL